MGTTAQKLEYLGTTKSQLKDMINYGLDNNNKIDSNTTFRNYVSSTFKAFIESLNNPNTLWGNLPKINGEGKEITLNNTIEAPMKLELKPSELEQGADPSPSNPQQIHTISGDNEIVVCGKNLLWLKDYTNTIVGLNNIISDQTWNINGTASSTWFSISSAYGALNVPKVETNENYTVSVISTFNESHTISLWFDDENGSQIVSKNVVASANTTSTSSFTFSGNAEDLARFRIAISGFTSGNSYNGSLKIQLEKGSTASPFVEHKEQVKEINLGVENLLDISSLTTKTASGLTITRTNDIISITGTRNATGWIEFVNFTLPVGTYTFSFIASGTTPAKPKVLEGYTQKSNTFIVSDSTQTYRIAIAGAVNDVWNCILKLQIEKGSKVNSYTPFGTTPIELCEIGDYKDEFLLTSGKNLCDGVNQNVYLNQAVTAGGIASDNSGLYIEVNGGNYTISTTASQTRYRVACSNVIPPTVGSTTVYNGQNKDGTSNSITIDTTGYTYLIVNATDLSAIQIEKGSGATEYEPYGSGQWYIKKNIGKVVLDGTNNALTFYNLNANRSAGYIELSNLLEYTSSQAINPPILLSTHLVSVSQNSTWLEGNISMRYQDLNRIYVCLSPSFTGASDMNNWLAGNNISVYYILSTPTYTLLNDTIQTQLNDIYNTMKSYKEQTSISQNNNDLAFTISANALLDLNSLIS